MRRTVAGTGMTRDRFYQSLCRGANVGERFRLTIEAMPGTNGTTISRLKRLLKFLSWYRFRCREIEELPPAEPKRRESSPARRRR